MCVLRTSAAILLRSVGRDTLIRIARQIVFASLMLLITFNSPAVAQLSTAFLPDSGQLQQKTSICTIVCTGLVAGAALYGLIAPKPDQFHIDFAGFRAESIAGTTDYRYYVLEQEVSAEEFFRTMDEEIEHDHRAGRQRRAAESRKRKVLRLAFVSYFIMLVDTLWLGGKEVDVQPFSISLQAVPDVSNLTKHHGIGLRLCVTFR